MWQPEGRAGYCVQVIEGRGMKVVRGLLLADQVLIVDGMQGCGKTLMTAVVGSFPRVELMQYSYQMEYAAALNSMGKLDDDAASSLLQMYADLQIYNVMMSRETNFRWTDLSGVRSNPNRLRYLQRLFQPGDASSAERIRQDKPILHLVTHWMLSFAPRFFEAFGSKLRFIEVVRHPLYMIKQIFRYMEGYGSDPRDFSIWLEYEGQSLPWVASGWEDKFLQSNQMDRSIYLIDEHQRSHDRAVAALNGTCRDQLLIVPFEQFVLDPWPYIREMETLLGVETGKLTRRTLKKQKVPRRMYAEGIDLPIYRENQWLPAEKGSDEAREFGLRRGFAAEHATAEAMNVLDRLCSEYEQKYLAAASA